MVWYNNILNIIKSMKEKEIELKIEELYNQLHFLEQCL